MTTHTLHLAPSTAPLKPQKGAMVLGAELQRLRGPGGIRGFMVLSLLLGAGTGAITLWVLMDLADEPGQLLVTFPLEVVGFVATLVMCIAATSLTGRDHAGHLPLAMSMVPHRGRLHWARAAAWSIVTALVIFPLTAVWAVICVLVTGATFWGTALLGVVAATVAAIFLVAVAHSMTVVLRRSFAAVLVLVGLIVVLPLVITIVGGLVPQMWAPVLEVNNTAGSASLYFSAMSVASVSSEGVGSVLGGALGLGLWAAVLNLIGLALFRRRQW